MIIVYLLLTAFLISSFGEFLAALAVCTVMLPVSIGLWLSYVWKAVSDWSSQPREQKIPLEKNEHPVFASFDDGIVNMNEINIK